MGDHIDLSTYETQAGGKDRCQLNLLTHAYSGEVAKRRETAFGICSGVRPYTDGFINLLGQQRLPDLMRLVGRDDLGSYDHTGRLFCMAETSHEPRRGPPLLGQDNEYVYRELLGYSGTRRSVMRN
jgi:hypothetical protein